MIAFRNAKLVLPAGRADLGSIVVEGARIIDILPQTRSPSDARDLDQAWVVPGFVDVHVHGVDGVDTLDGPAAVGDIARRLPRYGVTAFCPTTVACGPAELIRVLAAVEACRTSPPGARVLGAHLESNFINPEFRGAQPAECLRLPPPLRRDDDERRASVPQRDDRLEAPRPGELSKEPYSGADILETMERYARSIGIVTLAPELPGALNVVRRLGEREIRVSLGHSGATYEESLAGFAAGARHATHLFNRMSALHHRDPGLVGAVLEREDVDAELICDGYHVHPSAVRLALRLKGGERVLAITDGTSGAGLGVGQEARLGGRRIRVAQAAAFLDDGTLAGSTLTMDRAFRTLVERMGCTLEEAARLCATNPARALGLHEQGTLAPGMLADFVVLDAALRVRETWIDGRPVFAATG